MPGPIDNALKHLTELSPQDWVVRGGWPAAPAAVIDADIATLSGATDKVIRVSGPSDWLLAVDFQAGHDTAAKLPDLMLYNSALFKRHGLLVRSLLVVLHPGADSPRLTGFYERGFPGEPFDVALRYRIVRVWEVPPAQWLSAGLGLVPLAPLGAPQAAELPAVIAQMKQRLAHEVTRNQAVELWSAVYILMGLRYPDALIESLLQGVIAMEESVTYQAILRKGEAKEARKLLLLMGRSRFGEPSPEVVAALEAVTDLNRLEELSVRLLQVSSWQELLD
jgi:predicted transposase YdaD